MVKDNVHLDSIVLQTLQSLYLQTQDFSHKDLEMKTKNLVEQGHIKIYQGQLNARIAQLEINVLFNKWSGLKYANWELIVLLLVRLNVLHALLEHTTITMD